VTWATTGLRIDEIRGDQNSRRGFLAIITRPVIEDVAFGLA